ncbi:universal stress protein [candidate division CSSED10-310 bacterium]|uniref:Universal stress protein n=1 Tax=candidate division CSSED10-310 bacterium TaxID=2855610 RepID=A0ABV6YXC0_UNCC1
MKPIDKILLATDFSPSSKEAVQTAISVAQKYYSEISMIHVIPLTDSSFPLHQLKKMPEQRLNVLYETLQKKGVQVTKPIIAVGTPYYEINQVALDKDVNVIIIGSGEKKKTDVFQLGITAERLIRRSPKPVWVAKRYKEPLLEKILCPVEYSESSGRALKNAINLAQNFSAELTVLSVTKDIESLYSDIYHVLPEDQEQFEEKRQAEFDEFLNHFNFYKLDWKKLIKKGQPAREIMKICDEENFDLIVMGSVGKTGLSKVNFGSVAAKVTREVPCSFITVREE